jgi:hypothetical protein
MCRSMLSHSALSEENVNFFSKIQCFHWTDTQVDGILQLYSCLRARFRAKTMCPDPGFGGYAFW